MKNIISIPGILLVLIISNQAYGQCLPCKFPLKTECYDDCIPAFIQSVEAGELSLILGLSHQTTNKILQARSSQNDALRNVEEIKSELGDETFNQLAAQLNNLSESQTQYFNLSESDRKRFRRLMERNLENVAGGNGSTSGGDSQQ
ncbi:MAG: hypothetical protein KI790_01590 [Cyclobacteriaceae bacterium]|nr:hypothetical protein [Cyclobacteriaceae bacterium HetDA_MAG_MS6]